MSRPLSSEYSVMLGFSFNKNLAKNLLYLRNATLNQDFDAAGIVDGKEGSGKSVLGMQIALFLDKDRTLDVDKQICWTPKQFKEAVSELPPGKAIVWDEARRGVNRRRSMQDVNLEITDMLAECRQRNLFMVIIMPSFYDMDLSVAVWRTRFLVNCYYTWDKDNVENPLKRGFFRFYNEEGKKNLFTNKLYRQRYEYPYIPNMSFDASFVKHYVVDEARYRLLKRASLRDFKHKKEDISSLLVYLRDKGKLSSEIKGLVASFLGVSERTLYNRMKEAEGRENS